MPSYVFVHNYSRLGKIGISNFVFKQIAEETVKRLDAMIHAKSKKDTWELSKPLEVRIRDNQRLDINLSIDILSSMNVTQTCGQIQEAIANSMMQMVELIPFKINIKVVTIKDNVKKQGKTN